jgi:hypothetical protein
MDATDEYCLARLIEHGEEKLFRLKSEFIRTAEGRRLAEIRHDEMMAEIDRLKSTIAIEVL